MNTFPSQPNEPATRSTPRSASTAARRRLVITALSCLCVGVLGGALSGALTGFAGKAFQSSNENAQVQYYKISQAFQLVVQNHADSIDYSRAAEGAIRGMVDSLGDPYAEYLPPREKASFEENFRGSFQGIGIRFGIRQDSITVLVPIADGPSDRAGLQFGDKIVTIDGVSAVGIKQDSVPLRLKGPAGTQVTLGIKRVGEPTVKTLTITRGAIPTPSVEGAFMLDGETGYVFVNRFAATTSSEVVQAATTLRKQGMKKMILDLRYNPGGYLDQAWRLADEFVKTGNRLVFTKDRLGNIREQYVSNPGGSLEDIPLVVLINAGSASASEIVSGAIQDLDRGLVVGETSFGKGLVQNIFPLNDNSGLKITTARYYTPSGRLIQRSYRDKKKYLQLEGRNNNIAEGLNIDHKGESDSSRPAFKTLSGRTVLGGGGIVPDYVIKGDTATRFYDTLAQKGVFFETAEKFVTLQGTALRMKYGKTSGDFYTYWKNYTVSDEYMTMFKESAKQKGIVWNDERFAADKALVQKAMKAVLASYVWNWSDGSFIGAIMQQKPVEKARTLFPDAMRIAKGNTK
jgi:carboxyl-terminal processing protease